MKKTFPLNLGKKLTLLFLWIYSIGIFAQEITISGVVTDSNKEPLIGVTIQIQGTGKGTITDIDGRYTLPNVPSKGKLEVSYVGMLKQTIDINNRSRINIVMDEDTGLLDEVVVVAYGVQKKESVTAAISSIGTKDLKMNSAPNLTTALAGRLPGLVALQTSGQPGNDVVNLYLRGTGTLNDSSPLILIDGIPRDNISKLDPNEVATVSILKDASATAVFGVRGANGVILITTRRGEPGKSQLSVSADYSMQKFLVRADRIHSWEFAELRNLAYLNDNPGDTNNQPFSQYMIDKYRSGEDPVFYPDRDVFHDYFRDWAPQTRINANFNGGGDKFTYFLNAGYIGQGGNFKTEPKSFLGYDPSYKMDRYTFRGNIDYNIASNLKASLNIATYLEQMNTPQTIALFENNVANMVQNMIAYTWGTPPTDVGPVTVAGYGVPENEIIAQSGQDRSTYGELNRRGYREGTTNVLNSSLTVDWGLDFITKGLSVKGLVAFDSNAGTVLQGYRGMDVYKFEVAKSSAAESSYSTIRTNQDASIVLSKSMSTRYYMNFQGSLNYARSFGLNNVTGMAMVQRDNWETTGADLPYNILGLVGRVTYNYDSRYLAEFNIGYNGSEQFAPKNRFGTFPAFSFGWVPTNEAFLKDNPYLNHMKIRASYGITGNDKLGTARFLYQSKITPEGGGVISSLGRGQSIVQGRMGNEALKWEKAEKKNLGIDLEIMKDFSLTVDLFDEKRDQILISRETIPVLQGVPLGNIPKVNIGAVDNKGYELELTYRKSINKDLSFLVKGNYAYTKNTVRNADEVNYGKDYVYPYRKTGFSIGQQFGYKIDYSNGNGYINTQEELDNLPIYEVGGVPRIGDLKYVDVNDDGYINEKDMIPIGYSIVPRVSYGFSGSLTYKNVDFSFLFSGIAKSSRYLAGPGVTEFGLVGFYSGWHLHSWTAERFANGEEILYPALGLSPGTSQKQNEMFIMDRSFIRLKNVEIAYNFPKSLLKPIGMEQVRLYVNGNNLFTWKKMPLDTVDPEQTEELVYPVTKMFNFGLNITF